VITGEAGIGKTRIANELLRLAVLDGAMVVTYACTSGDGLTPLSSLLTLTHSLLAQPGALGCASEHLQYLRRLQSPEPAASPMAGGMAADIAYAQLVYSLAELAAAITDEGPLLVFIDDAHRLHQTSWRIFTDVVDRLADKRVMLVLAARQLPEWYATLGINGSDGRSRHARLVPFGAAESSAFLDMWSDKNACPLAVEVTESLREVSRGNPFYLSELAAHVGRGNDVSEPPASIRTLIELQIASVSRIAQRTALVIGLLHSRASLERIVVVLETTPLEFLSTLDELEAAGLALAVGPLLQLRHDIVVEVVCGQATPSAVLYLQTRIAGLLEREAEAARSIELLCDAMSLWERAGQPARAYGCGLRLGATLLELGMTTESAESYRHSIRYAQSTAEASKAYVGLVRSLQLACNWTVALSVCDECRALEPQLSTDDRGLLTIARCEATMWSGGAPDQQQLYDVIGDISTSGEIRVNAAVVAVILEDNSLGRESNLPSQAIADLLATGQPQTTSTALLRMLVSVCSGHEDAILNTRRYAQIAESLPLGQRVRALRLAGNAFERLDLLTDAARCLKLSLSVARALGLPHHSANCLDHLIRIELQTGNRQNAMALLEQLREVSEGSGSASTLLPAEVALAWLDRDKEAAVRLLAALDSATSEGSVAAIDADRVEMRMVLAFAVPGLIDDYWVRRYMTLVGDSLHRGTRDLWIAAACETLISIGRSHEASRVLLDWGAARLEEAAPSEMLLSRVSGDLAVRMLSATRAYKVRLPT
jgi:hypothetical protein